MNDLVCNNGYCLADLTTLSSSLTTKLVDTTSASKNAAVQGSETTQQSLTNIFTSVQQSNNPSTSISQISTVTYKQSLTSQSVSSMFTSQVTINKLFGSCSANGDCALPLKCIGTSGSQYCSCNSNGDCPGSGQTCTNNLCTCTATAKCPTGQICQTFNGLGVCTCSLDAQCSNKCVLFSNSLFGVCNGLKSLLSTITIAPGKKTNGQSCTEDSDCISNKCKNEVCTSN